MYGVVVYEVEMKQDWEGDRDAELDMIVAGSSSDPDFVKGWWFGNDTTGFAVQVVTDEAVAQRWVADNQDMPPEASVTLKSVKAYTLLREA
jgi:hypothetical protein